MAQNLFSRPLSEDEYDLWDEFVNNSPQGTIFSSILWLKMYGEPFKIFGCFKGQELVGGGAVFEDETAKNTKSLVYFTPYQGIIFRDNSFMKIPDKISFEKNITFSLIEELEKNYHEIFLYNHWNFIDVRPFYWHCYGRAGDEYIVTLRYTSLVDLNDISKTYEQFDDDTKYEIRKAEKNAIEIVRGNDSFDAFNKLHEATFNRQGIKRTDYEVKLIKRIYDALYSKRLCKLFFAKTKDGVNSAAAMIINDCKRAYYLFGASDPETRNNGATSLLLWSIFNELHKDGLKEIDLVGVNSPKRGRFKMGFGGLLVPYMLVERKLTEILNEKV